MRVHSGGGTTPQLHGGLPRREISPSHEGRTAFQLRVAVSVCRILARESATGPRLLDEEYDQLSSFLGRERDLHGAAGLPESVSVLARSLATAIRDGSIFATHSLAETLDTVDQLTRNKLSIVNPQYVTG